MPPKDLTKLRKAQLIEELEDREIQLHAALDEKSEYKSALAQVAERNAFMSKELRFLKNRSLMARILDKRYNPSQ